MEREKKAIDNEAQKAIEASMKTELEMERQHTLNHPRLERTNKINHNEKKMRDKHHLNKQFPPFPSHIPIHISNLPYSHFPPSSPHT